MAPGTQRAVQFVSCDGDAHAAASVAIEFLDTSCSVHQGLSDVGALHVRQPPQQALYVCQVRRRDLAKLRQSYEQMAARPFDLRWRQFELVVAQGAIFYRCHEIASEYAEAMATAAQALRDRRARELWVRNESQVTLHTLKQAWSDVTHVVQLARSGLESIPGWLGLVRPLRAVLWVGALAAALVAGHLAGVLLKRRVASLRRRIRAEWPFSLTAKAAYAGLRVVGESNRATWLVVAILAALWLLGVRISTLGYVALPAAPLTPDGPLW